MLRLAVTTMRGRRIGLAGAFVAVTLTVALVTAWSALLFSALRRRRP